MECGRLKWDFGERGGGRFPVARNQSQVYLHVDSIEEVAVGVESVKRAMILRVPEGDSVYCSEILL